MKYETKLLIRNKESSICLIFRWKQDRLRKYMENLCAHDKPRTWQTSGQKRHVFAVVFASGLNRGNEVTGLHSYIRPWKTRPWNFLFRFATKNGKKVFLANVSVSFDGLVLCQTKVFTWRTFKYFFPLISWYLNLKISLEDILLEDWGYVLDSKVGSVTSCFITDVLGKLLGK